MARKRASRAIGEASTEAMVNGLTIYGPHAVGFALFAAPMVVIAALAPLVLGAWATASLVINLAMNGVAWYRSSREDRKRGPK